MMTSPAAQPTPLADDTEPLTFVLAIAGFSRSDLCRQLGFTPDEVQQLDDPAMYRIARRVTDYFREVQVWEAVEVFARYELQQVQNPDQSPASRQCQSIIQQLTHGLRRFRHEQGWLHTPDTPAAHQLIALEAETIVLRYLNPAAYAAQAQTRLQAAWQQAAADGLLDTDRLIASYTAALDCLKAPITDPLWAEDDCLYNQHLEDYLAHRDYGAMAFNLWHHRVEQLVAQVQQPAEHRDRG